MVNSSFIEFFFKLIFYLFYQIISKNIIIIQNHFICFNILINHMTKCHMIYITKCQTYI